MVEKKDKKKPENEENKPGWTPIQPVKNEWTPIAPAEKTEWKKIQPVKDSGWTKQNDKK